MVRPEGRKGSRREYLGWMIPAVMGLLIVLMMVLTGIVIVAAPPALPLVSSAILTVLLGFVVLFIGGVAGLLGCWVKRELDAPMDPELEFRDALLFSLVFFTLIFSLLSFLSLPFLQARPEAVIPIFSLISFVSGFVPPGIKGILNNLRNESH